MAKQAIQPTYTFEDPNTPKAFEQKLREMATEKLRFDLSRDASADTLQTQIRKGATDL